MPKRKKWSCSLNAINEVNIQTHTPGELQLTSRAKYHISFMFILKKGVENNKKLESRGIEPRTSSMLRMHYTTKPRPLT